jgi:hypothetical protein
MTTSHSSAEIERLKAEIHQEEQIKSIIIFLLNKIFLSNPLDRHLNNHVMNYRIPLLN